LEKKRKAEEKARKKQEAKQHKGEGGDDAPALDEDSGEEAQQEHDPA
jgi:hypothetical protein